jgi:large subunit ribosomal protein LX
MTEAKIYRIHGYYKKGLKKFPINMDIRAMKLEDVMEKVYTDIGSRHYVKRKDIFIAKDSGITILENPEEARIKDFADIDDPTFSIPRD